MFETINCFIFGVFNTVAMNQILYTKLGIKPPRSLSNKMNHNHILTKLQFVEGNIQLWLLEVNNMAIVAKVVTTSTQTAQQLIKLIA